MEDGTVGLEDKCSSGYLLLKHLTPYTKTSLYKPYIFISSTYVYNIPPCSCIIASKMALSPLQIYILEKPNTFSQQAKR